MKPESIMHSDLLDILFEDRNKSYGAYALRKEYPRRLIKSLSVIVALMLALLSLQFVKKEPKKKGPGDIPDTHVTIVKFEPPTKPQTSAPAIRKPSHVLPPSPAIKNVVPRIVSDTLVKDPIPTDKDLDAHAIADSATAGAAGSIGTASEASTGGDGSGKGDQKSDVEVEPKIVAAPDVAPEFPGGVDGWIKFLRKNLRPKQSDEAYNVRVVVNFLVNEDGTISEFQILQSGGADFDNEVLRVMKKSPKWNAGICHGHKVKVYHAQPVIFVNQSDE